MRASADRKWSTARVEVSGRQLELFIEQPPGHMIDLMMECPIRRNGACATTADGSEVKIRRVRLSPPTAGDDAASPRPPHLKAAG